jgi:alcohol dehydrogenase (cytochrome c)
LALDLKSKGRFVAMAAVPVFVMMASGLLSVPKVQQGLVIVRLKATGALPDVGWMDLARMMRPGAHFSLPELAKNPNPYATIRNAYALPSDISAGGALFRANCAVCHGSDGSGGPGGPSLKRRQMVQGSSDWALFRTVSLGIRGTAMHGSNLKWADKWRLVAYVRSVTMQAEIPLDPDATAEAYTEPVLYENLRSAEKNQNEWLMYSGTYNGQRFSPNRQITPKNANGLRLVWQRQYSTSEQSIETSPLVVGNYMFVTVPPNRVEALDARTGALIWAYDRDLRERLSLCCGYVNRGLAVLGSRLYFGTLDGHLVALDIENGQVSWDVEIADFKLGYSITGAPLAVKNLIITGIAGGEYGIRGFVDARDADTGKAVWRFQTVPKPGEPGSDTWDGNAWKTGGGPTWMTGSFDAETNLVYWPTGNPSPNFEGKGRSGDNLYTNSVVALDADNGELRWYFQYMPHDVFDWDATEILVLFDGKIGGKPRRLLAQANRNGFYYLLDARTGKFLLAKAFAKQTWADEIDNNGRPVVNPSARPTTQGATVYPGVGGATNWWSPSYSPATGLLYVAALDQGGVFHEGHTDYHTGELFLGGSFEYYENSRPEGAVRALDAMTGEIKWEYHNFVSDVSGLLSTAGGVVFGSQDGTFLALDANTGREVWRVGTGGRVRAAPISFVNGGKQMVTIAAGHDILTFALP